MDIKPAVRPFGLISGEYKFPRFDERITEGGVDDII